MNTTQIKGGFALAIAAGLAAACSPAAEDAGTAADATSVSEEATEVAVSDISVDAATGSTSEVVTYSPTASDNADDSVF